MKSQLFFLGVFLSTLFAAAGKENQKEAPLRITFHDSNGLSVASAPEGKLELILFKSHTHSHLQIANTSDQNLIQLSKKHSKISNE